MSSIQEILSFRRESKEDYYSLLGCDQSSSPEQILAEYRVRAKELHPDKRAQKEEGERGGATQNCQEFQLLQEVILINQ